MKILHTVESYWPEVSGMAEAVRQISERLVATGHQVTVATKKVRGRKSPVVNGVTICEFNIAGNLVTGITGEVEKYRQLLLSGDFDIITNFAAQQWATDLALPILSRIRAKKVLAPTGFSGLFWPNYQEYYRQMPMWLKTYDTNIFLANDYRDINFAKKNGVKNYGVIPNGADEGEFTKTSEKNKQLILHVGNHTGSKGHEELIKIFNQAKLEDAVLWIIGKFDYSSGCGKKCQELVKNSKNIFLKDYFRAQTVAAFKTASLFFYPSRIECSPIVLFEALAGKTPFLATDVGNTREIIKLTGGGKLLPTKKSKDGYATADIDESTKVLKKVWGDKKSLKNMGEKGRISWAKSFTWEKIAKQYESVYKQLLDKNDYS